MKLLMDTSEINPRWVGPADQVDAGPAVSSGGGIQWRLTARIW